MRLTANPRLSAILAPALSITASVAVHGMVIGSNFRDEDLSHLFLSRALGIDYLFQPYAEHFIATFAATVKLLYLLFGTNAQPWFFVVLATHLLNVGLVYGIIRAMGQGRVAAAVASGLWGSCPAFQGTLQWFAGYSHILGTTAALAALFGIARIAAVGRPAGPSRLFLVNLALIAAAGTELTGALAALGFPVVALLVVPPERRSVRTALALLPASLAGAAAIASGLTTSPSLSTFSIGGAWRMFEGLSVYGAGLLLAPAFVTVDAATIELPASAATAAINTAMQRSIPFFFITVVLIGARFAVGTTKERRALFAMLGIAAAMYAAVAVGRAGAFGSPAALHFVQDRYHYDATPWIAIALGLSVPTVLRTLRPASSQGTRALCLIAVLAGSIWVMADRTVARHTWLNEVGRQTWTRQWTDLALDGVELVVENAPPRTTIFIANDTFRPASTIYALGVPGWKLPGIGASWVLRHGTEPWHGRTVRFVERHRRLLEGIRSNLIDEVSSMFVSPEDVADEPVRVLKNELPADVTAFLEQSRAFNDPAWILRANTAMQAAKDAAQASRASD